MGSEPATRGTGQGGAAPAMQPRHRSPPPKRRSSSVQALSPPAIRIHSTKRPGFACSVEGQARLPLPAPLLYQLLTHPDNAAILRSIDRCTSRRVEADDGCGRLEVAVEHETHCRFLWFQGVVRTPLRVRQDARAGTMGFALDPRAGCGHLAALQGEWTVQPDGPAASRLRVEQAFTPRGLPPLLRGAACSFASAQLRGTLEDLHAESLRILAGRPTLPGLELPSPPSDLSCDADGTCGGKEPPAAAAAADPASVLDLARVSGSSTASSAAGSSGRPSGAAMAASSAAAPASFPLPLAALQAASSSCLDASLQPQPVWRQLLDTRQLASLGAAAGLLLALHCLLLALLVA